MIEKLDTLLKNAALSLGALPFLLMLIFWNIPDSISAFANAKNVAVFPFLLAFPSVFYILDAYFSKRKYNYIHAIGLAMVAIFNHETLPVPHFIGAGIFFFGITFFAIKNSSIKQRLAITLFFGIGVVFLVLSYLYAEKLFFWAEVYMVELAAILGYGKLTNKID